MTGSVERAVGTWTPLRHQAFRALWVAQFASLIGTWANTVGAQWFLTIESGRPELVALVQTATSLPALALSLPAGVLADLLDRRGVLIVTQAAMMLVGGALAIVTLTDRLSPALLLAFIAALGVGLALTAPAWQASLPDLIPRAELPEAAALNSVAVNAARAVGPAIGGVVVALAGVGYVFAFNALTYVAFVAALVWWHPPPRRLQHEGERLTGAVRLAVGYVGHSPAMLRVLARVALWVLPASALWALLPLVANVRLGLGSTGYGVLFSSLGAGAVASVVFGGRLRARTPPSVVLVFAGVLYALAMVVLALGRSPVLAVVFLLLAGGSWIAVLPTLNATAQLILPGWVRARALATYMLVFQGSQAGGSALWGLVAGTASTEVSLLVAAAVMLVGTATVRLVPLPNPSRIDPGPSDHWPEPHLALDPGARRGGVLVTVEWRVPPENVAEFVAAMEYVARSRQRSGGRRWGLHRDGADPARFLETYQVASWAEHLLQHDRLTVADRLREEAAMRLTTEPVRVSHLFTV